MFSGRKKRGGLNLSLSGIPNSIPELLSTNKHGVSVCQRDDGIADKYKGNNQEQWKSIWGGRLL